MPFFGHDLMAYPAEDVVVEYALLLRELSQHDVVVCSIEAVRRNLMIEEHYDPCRIPHPGIPARDLIKSGYRQRSGDIMDHGAVDFRHDELAGMRLFCCRLGEYLLRQGFAAHG